MILKCARAGFLLLALALAIAAGAEPSLLGPTGLVQTPNTDTVPAGSYQFAGSYVSMDNKQFVWPVRLVAGISDTAELGVANLEYGDGMDGRLTNFVGKVALQREPDAPFGLAVGLDYGVLGEDRFEAAGLKRAIRIYAVASKTLRQVGNGEGQGESAGPGVRLNAGAAYCRIENGSALTSTRPFVGIEFATRQGAVVALEWRSEKLGDDVFSAAIRYHFKGYTVAQLGVTNNVGGLGLSNKSGVFVSLGWNFAAPQ